MKKVKYKKSEVQGKTPIKYSQETGGSGMWLDQPKSEIPNDGVSWLYNIDDYITDWRPRTGSRLFSNTALPRLGGRFTASQAGTTVTRTSGRTFRVDDVGRYFVVPGDEDYCNQIVTYISQDQVTVRDSRTVPSSTCHIRGRVWVRRFQKSIRRWFIQIDTRAFVSNVTMDSWIRVYPKGTTELAEFSTGYDEQEEDVILFNLSGTFRCIVSSNEPYYYKLNSDPPAERVLHQNPSDIAKFGRRYIYSFSRLDATDYWKDRQNWRFCKIQQETGTTSIDANGIDYGEQFGVYPIGTSGLLIGAWGVDADISNWKAITDGTVNLTINGETENFQCNFSEATGLNDVASILQGAINLRYDSVMVWVQNGAVGSRFVLCAGYPGGTVNYATAGTGGTDISGAGVGATALEWDVGAGAGLEIVNPPGAAVSPQSYQDRDVQWLDMDGQAGNFEPTHYTVYATKTFTYEEKKAGKVPKNFTWHSDVPCGSAFTCSRQVINATTELLEAHDGLFKRSDPFSTLVFQDSSNRVIDYLSDAVGNRIDAQTSSYAISTVEIAAATARQGAALGGGVVTMITKTGRRLVIGVPYPNTSQGRFSQADVGRHIWCADGSVVTIARVLSDTEVDCIESGDKDAMGATFRPTRRHFYDDTHDTTLIARFETSLADFTFRCEHRQHVGMPSGEVGLMVPGFMCQAKRGEDLYYWSSTSRRYLIGNYYAMRQYDDSLEGGIQAMKISPDVIIVICSRHSYLTNTEVPVMAMMPEIDINVALLPKLTMMDNIGTLSPHSIARKDIGEYILLTSEPAVRYMTAAGFGKDNLADRRVMKTIARATTKAVGWYDDISGYILWLEQEV